MKNTCSLDHISNTGNLDANLISRQYKSIVLAQLMELKSINPALKQSEITKKKTGMSRSSSTLQRCRHDIKMPSLYRNPVNNHESRHKI